MEQAQSERKLLGAQAEDDLMAYILGTPVPIGEKLPNEFELGQMFQVGRSTTREAVKSLVTKGILEVRRGDGTYVKSHCSLAEDPLGLSRLDDKYKLALELLDVRLILEPEIAASAAAHATPENKAELQTLCNEVEQLCLNGGDHTPKDIAFHTCIARCSQNRVMEMLVPIINTAVTTFASLTHRSLRRETIQTHRAITDAIVAGDAVGARCAMVMHLTYNRQAIAELWKEHQNQL
ncbi:MAG: FadR/GntR family transcriptional regulator [Gemmiger sp.]|uniref:FadR/GntR family transcriptional regulator n=1 Tax=Gemmiger sp. TaxID=2049027 RepID=UPI002E760566|nr:FadR/GntR family transcriptional regulator [Gemmiger sp.]MEE0707925.1 FadR/GntR family transcriptional regulator [Gemmiger sp.]